MTLRTVYLLEVGILLGLTAGLCGAAYAGTADGQAFRQEMRAAKQEAKAYAKAKRAEIQRLKGQIQTLRAQARSTPDKTAKQQLHAQLKTLREQIRAAKEELAQHRVQCAEQGLAFAQRRVEWSNAHLAKLQARKTGMERE